jgi:hypothetical protein
MVPLVDLLAKRVDYRLTRSSYRYPLVTPASLGLVQSLRSSLNRPAVTFRLQKASTGRAAQNEQRQRFIEAAKTAAASDAGFAGARINNRDPLALFAHDAAVKAERTLASASDQAVPDLIGPDGSVGIASPIQGTIIAINVVEGSRG